MPLLSLSFCSFRAQNRGSTVPRALLWAIHLLGFQPVFATYKPFIESAFCCLSLLLYIFSHAFFLCKMRSQMTQISKIWCLWHAWMTFQDNVQQLIFRAMTGRRPQNSTLRHCTPVNGLEQWRGRRPQDNTSRHCTPVNGFEQWRGRRPQDNTSRHCTSVNGFEQRRGEARKISLQVIVHQ